MQRHAGRREDPNDGSICATWFLLGSCAPGLMLWHRDVEVVSAAATAATSAAATAGILHVCGHGCAGWVAEEP